MKRSTQTKFQLFPDRRWPEISSLRFYSGIVIGLGYAFFFYAFLNLMREVFRFLTISPEYHIWVLPDNQLYLVNLCLALISSVWGHSICLSIWFQNAQALIKRKKFIIYTVMNDVRVLVILFILFFVRMSHVGLSELLFDGAHYIDLSIEFYLISSLASLVIFLQNWTYIRLKFGHSVVKRQVISAFVILIFSFLIANVNFYDYKCVNLSILSKDTYHNYIVDLPIVVNCYNGRGRRYFKDIFIAPKKGQDPNTYYINMNGTQIDRQDLGAALSKLNIKDAKDYTWGITNQKLNIHKNTPMSMLFSLYSDLIDNHQYRLTFNVMPSGAEGHPMAYNHCVLFYRIPFYFNSDSLIQASYDSYFKGREIVQIEIIQGTQYALNNSTLNIEEVVTLIELNLKVKASTDIELIINSDASFGSYVLLLSHLKELRDKHNDVLSRKHYQKTYEYLDNKKKHIIRNQSQLGILELTKKQSQNLIR